MTALEPRKRGNRYSVRHSNGRTWAVDCYFWFNSYYFIRERTWYFETEEEAREFKKKKEAKP